MKRRKWLEFGFIGVILTIIGVFLFLGNSIPVNAMDYWIYYKYDDEFKISLEYIDSKEVGSDIPEEIDLYDYSSSYATLTAFWGVETTSTDTNPTKLVDGHYWKKATGVFEEGKTYSLMIDIVYDDSIASNDHSSMSIVINDNYTFTDAIVEEAAGIKTYSFVVTAGTLDFDGYFYGGCFYSYGQHFKPSARVQIIDGIEMVNNHDGTITFTNLPTLVDTPEIAASELYWAYKACFANEVYFIDPGFDTYKFFSGSVATCSGGTQLPSNNTIDISSIDYNTGSTPRIALFIATTAPNDDCVYYGAEVFELPTKVIYDLNGGTAGVGFVAEDWVLGSGDWINGTNHSIAPTNSSLDFYGWYTDTTGGTRIESTDSPSSYATVDNVNGLKSITLYAQYGPDCYSEEINLTLENFEAGNTIGSISISGYDTEKLEIIEYVVMNNGNELESTDVIKYSESYRINMVLKAKNGVFKTSIYSCDDYYYTVYINGDSVYPSVYKVAEDGTLDYVSNQSEANGLSINKWITMPTPCNLVYELNGGTMSEAASLTGIISIPNPLPLPTKDGFAFGGWYCDGIFNEMANPGDELYYDMTLYAKWGTAVCKIGTAKFSSIQAAFVNANDGDVIELLQNVTLDCQTTLSGNKSITIDGNGYTIYGAGNKLGLRIEKKATLIMTNVTYDGNDLIYHHDNGVGGFLELESANLILEDSSTICNADVSTSSNVHSIIQLGQLSTITMNDGSLITNIYGHMSIFRLNNGSRFIMNGGTISDCHTKDASLSEGVVFYLGDGKNGDYDTVNPATFIMNGGVISNCSPSLSSEKISSGIIFMHPNCCAKVVLNGGEFKNNSASYGGVVYSNPKGGVTHSINVSGSIIAVNNYGSKLGVNAKSNIYLGKGGTFTINNALTSGALIGVWVTTEPSDSKDIKIAGYTASYSGSYTDISHIVSDKSSVAGVIYCDGTKDYDKDGNVLVGNHTHEKGLWMSVAAKEREVSFDANGHGTAPVPIEVIYGHTIEAPTALTATGFAFAGWYKEAGCTNKWDFEADTVTDNITLYAKWVEGYSVTYNTNGGNSIDQLTHVINLPNTLPTPLKAKYVFAGWYTNIELTNKAVSGASISEDTILYAKWLKSINSVNVTNAPTYVRNGDLVEKQNNEWVTSNITIDSDEVTFDYKVLDVAGNSWVGIAIHPKEGFIFYTFSGFYDISGLPTGFEFDGVVTSDNLATYRTLYDTNLIYVGDYLYRYI